MEWGLQKSLNRLVDAKREAEKQEAKCGSAETTLEDVVGGLPTPSPGRPLRWGSSGGSPSFLWAGRWFFFPFMNPGPLSCLVLGPLMGFADAEMGPFALVFRTPRSSLGAFSSRTRENGSFNAESS